ncbi:uncharacterized protein BDR25DRAFT_296804 [Lindgomyces ingoldianus]|uniref:Uncharacterized protein n=1 Tax=Lindgomyces ingoldianus TaxID=673940 RepID=A0ACB6QBY7_9PLEO|nr:uncharacterized protein BDR25DRAFT_296804 [Lindgomyces ingoldianus]KAF2464411.1 hypothetical protein BDR25DRAFT_296804 [Lindgomyces ingoldianus]
MHGSQRFGDTTFYISLDDVRQGSLTTWVDPSLEAVYLHFLVPIREDHYVGVQISIVPFSLREFPGQVFHSAQGAIVRCCDQLDGGDLLPHVTDAADAIYKACVSWHKWNLRAPGFWSEVTHGSQVHSPLDTSMDNASMQLKQQLMETQDQEMASPSDSAVHLSDGLMQTSPSSSISSLHSCKRSGPSNVTTNSTFEMEKPARKKRKGRPSSLAEPIMETADILLERLSSATISDAEVTSYIALANMEHPPVTPSGENVSRAWEMCINFARRSSQKLKNGRFLRFLSLCFFLIWEKYSEKQGKSAARLVNAKMREAGFCGHSRGFKTIRDETKLINRIIASIQESCGFQDAGILYHIVFEASNYQLLRTINRLGNDKKSSILEYMCKNIDLDTLRDSYPTTSAICVQRIIQQYLPNLSAEAINAAIEYQPIGSSRAAAYTEAFGLPPTSAQGQLHLGDAQQSTGLLAPDLDASMPPYHDGLHAHIFADDGSGGISDALDMLQGVEDSFMPFAVDVEGLDIGFPIHDLDGSQL